MTTIGIDGSVDQARVGADVPAVVARLRTTFESGRTRPREWRRTQLQALVRLLDERERDIAEALAADLGRSAVDAWLGDVASTKGEAEYALKHLDKWMRPTRVSLPLSLRPGRAFVVNEPLGTVLVIGPWNYPIYLTLGPLVAALAAGNTVLIKPSEHSPATSALLTRLLPEYLDPDAVAVVEGEADATQQLIAQGLDHIFFTGGPEIGKAIMAAAAPHLTPVTLELGGKSPAIVTADADLPVTARRLVWTKFLNSGQTCVAPDYVLAQESIVDQLVAEIQKAVTAMQGADALLPIVNQRQFARLASALETSGGTVVVGGTTDVDKTAIAPTVVLSPDPASTLMRDEIFGPVLPVVPIPALDDAIAHVRAGTKPLAAYLFSRSRNERRRVIAEISSGGMVVNHAMVHLLAPQLPFGGVGTSGMGAYHSKKGFETFSHAKSVLLKPTKPDLALTYPPYTPRTEKLLRRIF